MMIYLFKFEKGHSVNWSKIAKQSLESSVGGIRFILNWDKDKNSDLRSMYVVCNLLVMICKL